SMIYSATGPDGSRDLFQRTALPAGQWSSAVALEQLNGFNDETTPVLAADGRTLYFRRGNSQWFRRLHPNEPAEAVNIPDRVQQFALTPDAVGRHLPAIVMFDDLGQEERLFTQILPNASLPPISHLTRGYLPSPPPPGEQLARVKVQGGASLWVRPDVMQRFAVFLREGESLAIDGNLPSVPATTLPTGSLAALEGETAPNEEQERLVAGIAQRQKELDRLDAERRKYDLALPSQDDELDALRDQYYRASQPTGDTIPPRTTAKGTEASRARYAEELAELERMKAKFRRQQDEKLRQKSNGNHRWSETTTPPSPTTATQAPSIGTAYTPVSRQDQEAARQRAYQDSIRLNATVRSGLYGNNAPKVYEREAWENELQRDLPRTTPLSQEEVNRLDADYQRKLDELAALKAELNRLNGTQEPPAPTTYRQPYPANSNTRVPSSTERSWTAKGNPNNSYPPARVEEQRTQYPPTEYRQPAPATYQTSVRNTTARQPEPATYGYPATPSHTPASTAGIPAGISFIPNTAYPDGAGYGGLDQLVRQIQSATSVVEIRVHTTVQLDRRAAQLLSEERAITIRDYLLEQGISAKHFRVFGYGNNLTGQGGERVEVLR
ncbi:MAG: OmpA family protein, partial [Bacteroidota bacterium]